MCVDLIAYVFDMAVEMTTFSDIYGGNRQMPAVNRLISILTFYLDDDPDVNELEIRTTFRGQIVEMPPPEPGAFWYSLGRNSEK